MPEDHRIEVNELAVRHALARSFHASDPGDHAWRGSVGMGDARVTVDVFPATPETRTYGRAATCSRPTPQSRCWRGRW